MGNNVTRYQTSGWLYQPEMLNTASNRNGSKLRVHEAQPYGLTDFTEVGTL